MARIALVTTGGTIASRAAIGGDVTAEVGGHALAQSLGARLPAGLELTVDDYLRVNSSSLDLDMAFAMARRIADHAARADCDGVVVTHGTDSMEESAFLADLVVPGDTPVVFTGAQRSAEDADGDGPRNLASACRLAAAPQARGLGTMILFEDDFHAARDVTKTHASRTDTFRSGEHGKLGEVDGDVVTVHRRPTLRAHIPTERIETRVGLFKSALGLNGDYIRFCVERGARAVVVEGFGRGNAHPDVTAAIEDAVTAGTQVIMCTRCPEGRVKPVYGNGGGRDIERAGAIFAGDLSGVKARILAAVCLGAPDGAARLRERFAQMAG